MYNPILTIYPGSSSFFPGDTPFGYYDSDPDFQVDIDSTAEWCANRLGYGLSDVELQDRHFFTAFEEAVNEYAYLVNSYANRENILSLLGISYDGNLSQTYINPNSSQIFDLAKDYGNPIGSGGTLTWFTGSIDLTPNKQVYNLLTDANLETGSFSTDRFTIRKIFYEKSPAAARYFDPTLDASFIGEQFGFGTYTMPGQYLVNPLNYDILRTQAIEFNDEIRRSAYTFKLTKNRLRIFPIPTENIKLFFNYTIDSEFGVNIGDGISDISNTPYLNFTYNKINALGRQWIRKYTLAICKEILGYIRGKYSALPIADGEVTLNAADLLSAGKEERDALTTELKEFLDQTSKQALLERKVAESTSLNAQLKFYPTKIYVK